jgi:XTP/dITP diphosphohydrolase
MPHPNLDELIATLEHLRAPGGCAWDREQTHESLVRYLLEESHELVDAIEAGGRDELIEELGDVLYQVIFHADIAAEAGLFTIEDVAAHMTAKMIGRHPHVFGDATAATAADVVGVWDEAKRSEKPHRTSALDGVPQAMPSLLLADKLLGKAEKLGVDAVDEWSTGGAVSRSTTASSGSPASEAELGDILFQLVVSARANGLDAERALRTRLRTLQNEIRAHEAQQPAE